MRAKVHEGTSAVAAPEPEMRRVAAMWWMARNSPWVAIAVVTHAIAVAVLGVIYMKTHEAEPAQEPTVLNISRTDPDLPPPLTDVPEVVTRGAVETPDNEKPGPVNPDADYVPGADPGKAGEITDCTDPDKEAGIYNPDPFADPKLLSGATGGTSIGVGSVGHIGTNVPSAYVSRRQGGGGTGGEGLGQNGKNGRGGFGPTVRSTTATLNALLWLKNHQSPDGRWDADGFDQQCKQSKCTNPGESVYDPGVSGLAMLCFLGAGETHQSGQFKITVREGLKYLRSIQDSEGCFGTRTSQHFQYNHSIAALAMAEAYGMTQSNALRDPAQRGITFVQQSQNPYLAWRYGVRDGDNDTSVTGWMMMALKSGVLSGLEVDKGAFGGALAWVDKMTEPEFGKTGYQQRGGPPARTTAMQQRFPANNSESMTAVGVLVRIFSGQATKDDPMIRKGADLMARQLPKWDQDAGTIDFYYWYYGTLAMFQVGGPHWAKWNEAMKTAILDHQRLDKDRCDFGSWDAEDPWSPEGGRVYATALNCLCMEVYYRYGRVFGTSTEK
jgi:hypothetical protein